jgi:hypothetical protein
MAALTQTAANVGVGSVTSPVRTVQVGEAVTQGQPGYRDETTGKYFVGDADDADKDAIAVVFLTPAALDGYAVAAFPDAKVNLGATLVVGTAYYLLASGSIGLHSDISSGDYVTCLGIAETAALLLFNPQVSGVAKP